ncbi:MAG: hypothetical protein J0M26_24245 [Planctomycetes bacterium]|nr:hypothetical protein [Planctomycetota bacterium]
MKWNILVGSLVLGASLCTPSFGGGLLDRLLSLKGAGCDTSCCDTTPACDPGCGVENACDPGCGIENACNACDPGCGVESPCSADPGCGVEACNSGCAAPSCGTEVACCKPRKKPLLALLHSLKPKKACCDNACEPACGVEACNSCDPGCGIETSACGCAAAPACGPACGIETPACCDNGCDSGCKIKRPRLLDLLFKCKSKGCDETCCDAMSSCGCGEAAPAAPAAPAASEAAPMPPAPTTDHSAQLQSKRRVIQASSYVR